MSATGLVGQTIQALTAQTAAFESLLLMASALHKGVKRAHLETVVREFAGVPASLAATLLVAVALTEIVAAALLLSAPLRVIGATIATLVWAAYLVLIVRAIVQGRRDGDCGCSFGPAHRLGSFQVVRNGTLLALAVLVVMGSIAIDAIPLQSSQLLAAFALLAVYGALDQVMALRPLRSGEVL